MSQMAVESFRMNKTISERKKVFFVDVCFMVLKYMDFTGRSSRRGERSFSL